MIVRVVLGRAVELTVEKERRNTLPPPSSPSCQPRDRLRKLKKKDKKLLGRKSKPKRDPYILLKMEGRKKTRVLF